MGGIPPYGGIGPGYGAGYPYGVIPQAPVIPGAAGTYPFYPPAGINPYSLY